MPSVSRHELDKHGAAIAMVMVITMEMAMSDGDGQGFPYSWITVMEVFSEAHR